MRFLLLPAWRVGVDLLVLWIGGGAAALRHPIAVIFVALDGLWSLIEGLLARPELSAGSEARKRTLSADSGTLAFVMAGKRWVLITFLFQAAVLWIFGRRAPALPAQVPPLSIAGFLVYVSGAALRGWAMAVMGTRFKSWAVMREPEGLVATGPYSLVRHPSYLGLLMIAAALPLITVQVWALIVVPFLMLLLAQRINLEEQLLASAYGDDYARYGARARSRLIPFVW